MLPALGITMLPPVVSNPPPVIALLNIALPASLPSRVNMVISEEASVPLNIISELLAAASIVIFPLEVVIVTAASPVPISSAAGALPPA